VPVPALPAAPLPVPVPPTPDPAAPVVPPLAPTVPPLEFNWLEQPAVDSESATMPNNAAPSALFARGIEGRDCKPRSARRGVISTVCGRLPH